MIVKIRIPLMDRAWFKVHNCIKDDYFFRVVDQWESPSGIPMYELACVSGKPIPWRNKVMAKWCSGPIDILDYWRDRLSSRGEVIWTPQS